MKQESYFSIFFSHSFIQILNFFQKSWLNIRGEFAKMKNSSLSFSNKISTTVDWFFIIFQAWRREFLLETGQGLFESVNFIILLIFDSIQFETKTTLNIFFAAN